MNDVDQINQLLNEALADADTPKVPAQPRARMLANIRRRASAPAPDGTFTVRAADTEWEPFDDGIDRRLLIADNGSGVETSLYRLQPGSRFVSHAHTHQESCWVVDGSVTVDGDHVVYPGDMHVALAGHVHGEVVARTTALLLIQSQVYVGPLTPT